MDHTDARFGWRWLLVGVCAFAIGCGSSTKGADEPTSGSNDVSTSDSTDPAPPADPNTDSSDTNTDSTSDPKPDTRVAMAPTKDANKAKLPPTKVANKTADKPKNKAKDTRKAKKRKKQRRAKKKARKRRGKKARRTKKSKPGAPLTDAERIKLSAFLVKPAQAAFKAQQWPRAVALYQGLVAARGAGSPEAIQLAKAWTVAGQYDAAVVVWRNFLKAAQGTSEQMSHAGSELKRLQNQQNPFKRAFTPRGARGEAFKAFKTGRVHFRKKNYRKALLYYSMGYALDADLPGFLRELGSTYDKLGQTDKKVEFYRAYLRRRPFGKNARVVRTALKKLKGTLGRLTIASAMKCDEVWVNRQRVAGKLPIKKLMVSPGRYKALCVSRRYQIAYFEYVDVKLGAPAKLQFNWAVVVNKLENPYGRIRIQDARTGTMMDLGIAQPEYGVIVPKSGQALKMVLTSLDGAKKVERFVRIPPGAREIIKW